MTYRTLAQKFATHTACIKFLEKKRWNNKPTCPYCQSPRSSPKTKGLRYTCLSCNRSYSVTVGTVFESSKVPLNKWFATIYLLTKARKSMSSEQLARTINVSRATALFLKRKIHASMSAILYDFSEIVVPVSRESKEESLRSRKFKAKDLKKICYKKTPNLKKLFSRSVFGTFHQLSEFYAQYYLNEIIFIYSYKETNKNLFDRLMEILWSKKIAFM